MPGLKVKSKICLTLKSISLLFVMLTASPEELSEGHQGREIRKRMVNNMEYLCVRERA
jgi:hypothetical protein